VVPFVIGEVVLCYLADMLDSIPFASLLRKIAETHHAPSICNGRMLIFRRPSKSV
jgi:hypothetical protein